MIGGFVALAVLVAVAVVTNMAAELGLGTGVQFLLLFLCLPFALPLAVARGVAIGSLNTRSAARSAQVEMWTRLIGAAVFRQAGLGVEAVAAAIALSVVAGLVLLRSLLGMIPVTPDKTASGLVQAGQVILLDGDVIAAQILFGADDVGAVAAPAQFQRLQFLA